MKVFPIYFLLIFCLFTSQAWGQQCASYQMFQNNKTFTWASYTKRGDPTGTVIYKNLNVVQKGNSCAATVKAEILDKNKKSIHNSESLVKYDNGVITVDMRLYLPPQQSEQFNRAQANATNKYLEYPLNTQPGQLLKDGRFVLTMDNNGIQQVLDMTINNRKVLNTERLTTNAGSWNCTVISYYIQMSIQTGPITIPLNLEAKEWFTPDVGIVKTETLLGRTELISIK